MRIRNALLCLFIFASVAGVRAQELVFSTIENQPVMAVTAGIIKEVYARLGYSVTVLPLAPARAAVEASKGLVDGEVGRIFSFNQSAPNLIRVSTPFFAADTVAFARRDRDFAFQGAESLKSLTVARIRGVLNSTDLTKDAAQIHEFGDLETMFKFLDHGRADVAVTNRIGGMITIRELDLEDVVPLEPPLATTDCYHFLDVHHADLVPKVDAMIRQMAASGELARLTREIENKVGAGERGY